MLIKKAQQGFAMVEVLVTAIIIAIAVSGLGILLMRVIQATQDNALKSQAMWMLQDYVGRIRSNPEGARRGDYELSGGLTDCTTPPGKVCAEYYKSGAEVAAQDCKPTQMATFDKWITVCGLNSDISDSSADFMVNPKLTSQCVGTYDPGRNTKGTTDCVQYEVTLGWDIRIAKVSDEAAERIHKEVMTTVVEIN
ncbi:MAG: prepilin-type N-terminal cleavage/methylation domain-containing protein [Bermanella sp.]|jgi:prepilin-type N-terminal cleavage/methylation domain